MRHEPAAGHLWFKDPILGIKDITYRLRLMDHSSNDILLNE